MSYNLSDNLVGLIEIAQAAGVQRPVVTMWRSRHDDFPDPLVELKIGPVFWWPDVKSWLERHDRATDANWTIEQVWPNTKPFNKDTE